MTVLSFSPLSLCHCVFQVSDWWEEYIYLRGRGPIMVNSNYYVMVNSSCQLHMHVQPQDAVYYLDIL